MKRKKEIKHSTEGEREREMKSHWIVIIISVYHKRVLLTKIIFKEKTSCVYMFVCLLSFFPWKKFPFCQWKKSVAPAPVFLRAQEVKLSRFFIASGLHWITTISEPRLISFPLLHIIFLIFVPFPFDNFCTFLMWISVKFMSSKNIVWKFMWTSVML